MNHGPLRSAKPTQLKRTLGLSASLLIAAACCSSAHAAAFIDIVPTFDFGGLTAPQQTQFTSTINAAISFYETTLKTPAALTVNILFKADESVSLGQSSTFVGDVSYTAFRAGLVANAIGGSADDTTALSFLPIQSANPVTATRTCIPRCLCCALWVLQLRGTMAVVWTARSA